MYSGDMGPPGAPGQAPWPQPFAPGTGAIPEAGFVPPQGVAGPAYRRKPREKAARTLENRLRYSYCNPPAATDLDAPGAQAQPAYPCPVPQHGARFPYTVGHPRRTVWLVQLGWTCPP